MATLERAIAIAVEAHAGQVDKGRAAYILHSLRVMARVATDDEQIVAALHDVVEDCPGWSLERLRAEGFSDAVVAGLDAVTRRGEETYEAFVTRAAAHPIGRTVKLADLIENSDLSRLPIVTDRDRERVAKYQRAIAALA